MNKFEELQLEQTRAVGDGVRSATLMNVTGATDAAPGWSPSHFGTPCRICATDIRIFSRGTCLLLGIFRDSVNEALPRTEVTQGAPMPGGVHAHPGGMPQM